MVSKLPKFIARINPGMTLATSRFRQICLIISFARACNSRTLKQEVEKYD